MIRNENYKTLEEQEQEKAKEFLMQEKKKKEEEEEKRQEYERNKKHIRKEKIKSNVKNILLCFIIAAIISGLIIRFVLFKAYVPSYSMVPTLNKGDQVFVTRLYNYDKIQRGDILVFNSKELNDRLVKRVIGMPGDIVKIKQGEVYINDQKLDEPYVKNVDSSDKRDGVYYVPSDSYFFLGDNRPVSDDAGLWDNPFISKDDIIGKAQIRVYPFKDFGYVNK